MIRGMALFLVRRFSTEPPDWSRLRPFLDFTRPSTWYPATRNVKRTVICHVGPTNSGKTYSALQKLLDIKNYNGRGIYCAPLRLLAIEMYEKLNGKYELPCALRTGEITCGPNPEGVAAAVHLPPGSKAWQDYPVVACTVEMADTSLPYDVAIIDEVQMMADQQRGWAFTQAVLGLPAKRLYLCGEEAAIPLIKKICQETGDNLEIVRFNRLSPLQVKPKCVDPQLKHVEPGDCVVAFSRRQIFEVKSRIESNTGRKCAVVYGNLPIDSRTTQARLFNAQGKDHSILVASDAVGMGLNLNIRRIIFNAVQKFNGEERELVPMNQIKQIAGRAGRFGTSHGENGIVTTLRPQDMPYLVECLQTPNEDIKAAGLLPSADHIVNLHYALPHLKLPDMIQLYKEQVSLSDHYFLCHFKDMQRLALLMEPYQSLSMKDRFQLACAPVKKSDELSVSTFRTVNQPYLAV